MRFTGVAKFPCASANSEANI